MRIRLVINRNGLPSMKIWWDTSSFQPGDDKTVSSLLARVSQIVPLESSKWGLEDYAVEIEGFEILHFQEVETVIREADEVVIRPLSSAEIKQRRLSGRRQISTSGRRLIDGTPFGRCFLRPAPDRPSLSIPPRKRRKIEQADDTIMVQAGGETDYSSYSQGEKEEERDEGEGRDDTKSAKMIGRRIAPTRNTRTGNYTPILEGQGEVYGNGGEYDNPLLDYYHDRLYGREWDEGGALKRIAEGSSSTANEKNKESEEESDGSLEDEGVRLSARNDLETILGVDSHDSSEDEDFNPSSSHSEDSDSEEYGEDELTGEKPPLATIPGTDSPDESNIDPHEVMLEVEGSDNDGEHTSESDHTSSDSSSESPESESESESDSDSDSDSDSETGSESGSESKNEEVVSQQFAGRKSEKQAPILRGSQSSSSSSSSSSEFTDSQQSPSFKVSRGPSVAPGTTPHQGTMSTKARNKRKSDHRRLKKLVELGTLPKGTDYAGYLEYIVRKQINDPPRKLPGSVEQPTLQEKTTPQKQPSPGKKSESGKHLEEPKPLNSGAASNSANRRKRYRKAFSKAKKNGTVPEGQDLSKWIEIREQKRKAEQKKDGEGDITLADFNENVGRTPTVADNPPIEESSRQREVPGRPSVNLNTLQRTVIHDLGVGKKATAAEEDFMRKEWAQTHRKDTVNKRKGFARDQFGKRPKKIIYDDDGNPLPLGTDDAPDISVVLEDPDAWRKRLVLSAVECEWEGAELPLPNFPFKQATFQSLNEIVGNKRKRGGKGKREQQKEYWGEDYAYGQDDGYSQQGDWTCDYYDDTTNTNGNQTADTIMEESEPVDDLPLLPEDIDSLSRLTKPVLPHTVIAFKQLTMDANYTPILADYRTAIVDEVDDQVQDGPFLVLKLAIRDRLKRDVDEMGEKVLRKFEMPGNNDDDEGRIELMFGELLEPRVVKLPEASEESDPQDKLKDMGNAREATIDGVADVNGPEEAMGDAPQEHQAKASDREHHMPAPGQGENATGSAATVDGEAARALEEEAVGRKVPSPPLRGEPTETPGDQGPDLQIGAPTTQPARTNSPVYSQNFREFKTPEPEARRDIPMMDKVDCHVQIADDGEDDSTPQPVYESDSDGLPTLEFMLGSQKASVSTQVDDEPRHPSLAPFSSFEMKALEDAGRGLEKPLDEQQTQKEVQGAKKIKSGKGRQRKLTEPPQAQVIDLTSDLPIVENSRRRKPRDKGAKGGVKS